MPSHREVVESYFEGFRASDHERILALLTDDVVWNLPGHARHEGKAAFDAEIENEAFEGSPRLNVERLVEEGDVLVAFGEGEGRLRGGGDLRFAFCTVITFAGELIGRVDSYVVPLG